MCASPGGWAFAQAYPSKPVRIIVPFPPGASPDIIARIVGRQLTERWGQQIVVDNRGGAGGNLAVALGAKATPDGYTLTIVSNHFVANPSIFKKVPYDVDKDFAPVILAASNASILVVNPALGVDSVKALIALARANPGKINYSSGGNGSVAHLATELFKSMAGIDIVHVPYKGPADGINALIAGQVALMVPVIPVALPHVKSGRLTALAITSSKHSPILPKLPTVAEAGLAGYEALAWLGILAPADTPKEVIAKINADFARTLQAPDMREQLINLGIDPIGSSPEEFGAFLKAEFNKWAKVVKEAGMRAD